MLEIIHLEGILPRNLSFGVIKVFDRVVVIIEFCHLAISNVCYGLAFI